MKTKVAFALVPGSRSIDTDCTVTASACALLKFDADTDFAYPVIPACMRILA